MIVLSCRQTLYRMQARVDRTRVSVGQRSTPIGCMEIVSLCRIAMMLLHRVVVRD